MTRKQQELLQKHALERLNLETRQAQQWYEFYQHIEPNSTLADMWLKTLRHRIELEKAANEHAANAFNDAPTSPTA